jgi:hypothetical protein
MTLEAVTAALVALFDAALSVPAFDGAVVTEQIPPAYVVVGWAEDADDSVVTLDVSDMGNRWDDEAGEIQCAAYSWAGNGTLAQHGVIAAGLVDGCRAALLASPTLGGVLVAPYSACITRVTRVRQQTDGGPVVRYGFTITYATLLTP